MRGDEREKIYRLVQQMKGGISRDFTTDVTHLISSSTSSEKYTAAVKLRRPVVKPEWVWEAWEKYQELERERDPGRRARKMAEFDATSFAEGFLLAPFVGCTVCVTGLDETQRAMIERETVRGGGVYSRDLTRSCTHLLAPTPTGQKYQAAVKWDINVVHPSWFDDSLQMGGCMEERFYSLLHDTAAGPVVTPVKGAAPHSAAIGVAADCAFNPGQRSRVKAQTDAGSQPLSDDAGAGSGGGYLRGCKVFLGPGHSEEKTQHMVKIIRESGATRVSEITPPMTHYVTAHSVLTDLDRELLAPYLPSKRRAQLPFSSDATTMPPFAVVANTWLRECYQKCRAVPTQPHEPHLLNPIEEVAPNHHVVVAPQPQPPVLPQVRPYQVKSEDETPGASSCSSLFIYLFCALK